MPDDAPWPRPWTAAYRGGRDGRQRRDAWNTRHQQNLIDLAELGPVDRARQMRAREALRVYADAMWDTVKATKPGGGSPMTHNP
ncbi:hypothetical protein AB0L65_40840 [Nonomuraea sp. NPDC052116]|uniref:hypothetical protein n=1 Tax=Nonomuraea sp. NPDC052116 TaxID=3155665 RepID=UPI00343B3989